MLCILKRSWCTLLFLFSWWIYMWYPLGNTAEWWAHVPKERELTLLSNCLCYLSTVVHKLFHLIFMNMHYLYFSEQMKLREVSCPASHITDLQNWGLTVYLISSDSKHCTLGLVSNVAVTELDTWGLRQLVRQALGSWWCWLLYYWSVVTKPYFSAHGLTRASPVILPNISKLLGNYSFHL